MIKDLDRNQLRRQKELEAKARKEEERKAERESIKRNAEFYRQFINDERYAPYKVLLETLLKSKIESRNNLKNVAKTNDEYLYRALVLDGQIEQIRDILTIPDMFINYAETIESEEKQ